jgi:bacillolysin
MRSLQTGVILILTVCGLAQAAGPRRSPGVEKTRKPSAASRTIPGLAGAGPVWKHARPLPSVRSTAGVLRKSGRPGEEIRTLASDLGLTVRDLRLAGNGTLAFISGDLGRSGQLKKTAGAAPAGQTAMRTVQEKADLGLAQRWLETFAPVMKIDRPASEFFLSRRDIDEMGMRHLRLQQTYRGLPVWAGELTIHLDAENRVYAVNGRYAPTPAAVDPGAALIDGPGALERSRAHLAGLNLLRDIPAGMGRVLRFSEPTSVQTIWIDKRDIPHLAWQVDLYANVRDWFTVFIDAASGEVLNAINNTKSEGPVDASGLDLGNVTRSFRAYEESGTYYMLSDVNGLSGPASQLPENPAGGLLVIDLNNTDATENSSYFQVTSRSRTSWDDASAVSGMVHLGQIAGYWMQTHGRRGIDNSASTMIMVVNVTEDGQPMDNAYWNGQAFFCGNGNEIFKPLAGSLDVAAHEVMHGITEYTANLVYQDESGALNESMSDFFACMVDRDDWVMGEDIMKPGTGSGLRDLAHPGNADMFDRLPADMDDYLHTSEDNGGVHTNCGIPSRAAVLIANSVGREKAEKIYYRALSFYLTRQAQFLDARKALEQSARDLHGDGAELAAVRSAFDAVKVTEGGGSNPGGDVDNEVPAATGGTEWIAFVRDDGQIGLVNLSEGDDYVLSGIRAMGGSGAFSQLSVTADGNFLYFINESGFLARADLSGLPQGYEYETFDSYYIQTPGDLWSAAVSRDNRMVALTSVYDENLVYLILDEQIYSLELDLPTTQNGITASTIRYADVLDWSPNTDAPMLAFDAFNSLHLSAGEDREWWSMGEIDFSGEDVQLYPLLPSQSDETWACNVQFSSTDPDRIAYSYFDEENNADIHILNFAAPEENRLTRIQFPGRQVERPSFSPDDKNLVVDRLSDHALLNLNLDAGTFSVLNLSTGARNPEWFMIGGSSGTEAETVPAADCHLEGNYPNPFNSETTIAYTMRSAGRIRMTVHDGRGRLVRTLADGVQGAGRHIVRWQGCDAEGRPAPSGVYFCVMRSEDGFRATRKLILLK